jgi:hypothetical protein
MKYNFFYVLGLSKTEFMVLCGAEALRLITVVDKRCVFTKN